MPYRRPRDTVDIVDDRESFYSGPAPPPDRRRRPPPRREFEEDEFYERQVEREGPVRGRPTRNYEDVDGDIQRVRERSRGPARREAQLPNFMREDLRRPEPGPLVLRQREVETIDRERRSPSPPPVRVRQQLVRRATSLSPGPPSPPRDRREVRTRFVERDTERIRSPSVDPSVDRLRARFVERERERSPTPPNLERVRTRIVERERERTPSPPPERERERIRIIERERERIPSPSPSPPPPPPELIRGPTIERQVITHYTDINHGVIAAPRLPSPAPPPRVRPRERDTEIDVVTDRNKTEVDIRRSASRGPSRAPSRAPSRPRSFSRERPSPAPVRREWDEDIVVQSGRDRLRVDIDERKSGGRRRAHSAAPPATFEEDEEAEYITSRINERGRMGEAWNGATRDWTIVDVPPGTERVKMDGVGGGAADVTWSKYSGVRRARFVPERDGGAPLPLPLPLPAPSPHPTTVVSTEIVERPVEREHDRLSVQIYDKNREVDVVEKVKDNRVSIRGPPVSPARRGDMWTEITKDLVVRDAIEDAGYEYEETDYFFYVMQYLRYEDVLELVQRSDMIRRARKDRVRELQWEREHREEWDRRHRVAVARPPAPRYDDERVYEREVVYDRREPARHYYR